MSRRRRNWSDLPQELLHTIANKLPHLVDYLHFRSVCHNFHSSIPITPTQLPFLLLPHSPQKPKAASTNNTPLKKLHSFTLPHPDSHRPCGSSQGWLLMEKTENSTLFLLNFMTRERVELPQLKRLPNVETENRLRSRDGSVRKMVLSADPSQGHDDFVVLVILDQTGDLAFCKRGDECWTFIEEAHSYSNDVIYHKGLFYAVNKHGAIAVCDVSGDVPSVSYIKTPQQTEGDMQYVVSFMDEILLVTRYLELDYNFEHHQLDITYKTSEFQVFKLDLNGPIWENITSLNDCILFIGENSSLALSTLDFPELKGNRIFYTDDYSEWIYDGDNGDHDLGVYNLEDGSIEALPCYPKNSYSGPPIWVTPNPC